MQLGADKSSVADVQSRVLLTEGFLSEMYGSLSGGTILTALACLMGGDPLVLAALTALPFLAQFAQCFGPTFQRRMASYAAAVVRALFWSRLLWLVPVALPFFTIHSRWALGLLLVNTFVMALLAMLANHGWTSWIAETVPAGTRAALFGRRNGVVTSATLLASPLGALVVDHYNGIGADAQGYAMLGVISVVCGCAGAMRLKTLPDAPPPASECDNVAHFVRTLRRRPAFRRVLGFFMLWGAATGLPAPFWDLYMLQSLHMSFLLICAHTCLVLLVRLAVNGWWIRIVERHGPERVLIACSLVIGFIPLLWLLPAPSVLWPLWLEACISGVVWTGFNQAAFILPMAALAPRERAHGLAVFNVGTGTTQFVAALVGGVIMSGAAARHAGDLVPGFGTLMLLSLLLRVSTGLWALHLSAPNVRLRTLSTRLVGFVSAMQLTTRQRDI